MKRTFAMLALVVVTAVVASLATWIVIDSTDTIPGFTVYTVMSDVLGEEREIIVRTPAGTGDNPARMPVIVVFGGNSLTSGIAYDAAVLTRVG